MAVDIVGNICALQSLVFCVVEVAFHFAVESVPHPFEHDITVAVDSRALSHRRYFVEYLIYIRHVEISAQAKVLCPPVVPSQEWMHILQSAFAGS